MVRKLAIALLCFLHFGRAFAQEPGQVDSLKAAVLIAQEDTHQVKLLNSISADELWHRGNRDTAFLYAQRALKLAEKLAYKKEMAVSYTIIGIVNCQIFKYPEALKNLWAARNLNEEIGNKNGVAFTYSLIGNTYNLLGNQPEALKHYYNSLTLYEELESKRDIGWCYKNIGNIYYTQGNLSVALPNYYASLKIFEEMGDKRGMANAHLDIGNVYTDQKDYSEALNSHNASFDIYNSIDDKPGIVLCYMNIGTVHFHQGNYPVALSKYLAALKISEEFGYMLGSAKSYIQLGRMYLAMGAPGKSKAWLQKGLTLSRETGIKSAIISSYYALAATDSVLGDFQDAYEHYKMYIVYRDSIYNEENTKKQTQIEMQYEFDKKETALQYQHQLTTGELEKQQLLNQQQAQALILRSKELALTSKEKDLQHLAYLKEKVERQDKEKQLQLSQKEKDLQATTLQKQEQEIAAQKAQRNLFIGSAGLMLLLACSVFIGLKRTTKEKRKSESLLLNILPEEVAEELKAKGHAEARQFDQVSVLFTDFVRFTQTAEHLEPQTLVQELHECFTAFDYIIERYGLEKIKTIGDAYLAVCGLPNADPQHAQKTVRAALEIRDFMQKRNQQEHSFQIRIGIHSGSVVAGIVGVKKFSYDIWGDTVNTAARMEQSSEAGKINISETTYELVANDYNCIYRGEIAAKHKGMMKMFFVQPN